MIENKIEKHFLVRLNAIGMIRATKAIDSFATWLFAGFAGVYGLLFSNVSGGISSGWVATVRHDVGWFICIAITAGVEKFLAVFLAAYLENFSEGMERGVNLPPDLNMDAFMQEAEFAYFGPFRFVVKRSFKKIRDGNITSSVHATQVALLIQSGLVVFEVAGILRASFNLATALPS